MPSHILLMTLITMLAATARVKVLTKFKVVCLLSLAVFTGIAGVIVANVLFVVLLNLLLDPVICTAFVRMTFLEKLIPFAGALLALSRRIDHKFFRARSTYQRT